jgi:hypothetical protein
VYLTEETYSAENEQTMQLLVRRINSAVLNRNNTVDGLSLKHTHFYDTTTDWFFTQYEAKLSAPALCHKSISTDSKRYDCFHVVTVSSPRQQTKILKL